MIYLKKTISVLTALSLVFSPLASPLQGHFGMNRASAETQNFSDNVSIKLKNYLGNKTTVPVTIKGEYQIKSANLALKEGMQYSVQLENNQLALYENGIKKGAFTTFTAEPKSYGVENQININGISYLGVMAFSVESGYVRPVNTLPVEDYLKGVVPYEMSDSYPLEALKSQAVAARTYVLGKGSLVIDDTTANQVYKGYNAANVNSIAAVEQTQGDVLKYNGQYVQAFFMASNGGLNFTNANSWGSTALPYFQTKSDPYTSNYIVKNPSYGDWTFAFNKTQINTSTLDLKQPESWWGTVNEQDSSIMSSLKSQLKTKGLIPSTSDIKIVDIPTFTLGMPPVTNTDVLKGSMKIEYFEKTTSGIVKDAYGNALKKAITITDTNYNIRYYIGTSIMKSPYIKSLTNGTTSYSVTGSGIGHGIGMSQVGAREAATEGLDFTKILNFYYPNTQLVDEVAPTISSVGISLDADKNMTVDYTVDENATVEMNLVNGTSNIPVLSKTTIQKGSNENSFNVNDYVGDSQLQIKTTDSYGNVRTAVYSITLPAKIIYPEIKNVSVVADENNIVTFSYELNTDSTVDIIFYTANGSVYVTKDAAQTAGVKSISFDASQYPFDAYGYSIISKASGRVAQQNGTVQLNDIVVPEINNLTVTADGNNLVTFNYDLSRSGTVSINLYDANHNKTIVSNNVSQNAGTNKVTFDAYSFNQGAYTYDISVIATNNKSTLKSGTVSLNDAIAPVITNVSVSSNKYDVVTFNYSLNRDASVSVSLTNASGVVTQVANNQIQTSGDKSLTFDATKLPSGTYAYQISANAPNGKVDTETGSVTINKIMDVPYKVISGDTLWNISVKYGTTVAAIKTKNNLTSDTLFIGQQLVIPVPETTKEFPYVVVSGDYLAKIAIQFKTTVDVIKTRNNLLTDSLSVGQKLIIPNANYIQ